MLNIIFWNHFCEKNYRQEKKKVLDFLLEHKIVHLTNRSDRSIMRPNILLILLYCRTPKTKLSCTSNLALSASVYFSQLLVLVHSQYS